MYSCRGIRSAASLTLLLIPGTPNTAFSTTATLAGMENIGVYLVITISACVDIVCKQVTGIAKDI